MKYSMQEALVYPVVCGIVILISAIPSSSGEGAIVPASTSLWTSRMGPMGGMANPNSPHHRFYRFSPFFYSKNAYAPQNQRLQPKFNRVDADTLKGSQRNFPQNNRGTHPVYLGQPASPSGGSFNPLTPSGNIQPYGSQGPTSIKAGLNSGVQQSFHRFPGPTAQTASAIQPYKRLPSPNQKAANAQPFKRLAIPVSPPVEKPSSSFQLRLPLPTSQPAPSDTPLPPYKRLPGSGLNNTKKLPKNTEPTFVSVDKDDSDVVIVKSEDLVDRRNVYEQDVEVNSKLYKGFRVYPAVPLDHNEY